MSLTSRPIIYKYTLSYITVFTVPEDCTTVTVCCIVDKFSIVNNTICSAFVPVNSTTIGSCSVVYEVRVIECGIIVIVVITMKVYCSTTGDCSVELKPTIIYKSIVSCPYDCTTVTLIMFCIFYISQCMVFCEV